uniref:Uncharacterized protein n=1 Tax=Triticum urartu TaxID=4572 RepID=A0A8R7TGS9_TRIUA
PVLAQSFPHPLRPENALAASATLARRHHLDIAHLLPYRHAIQPRSPETSLGDSDRPRPSRRQKSYSTYAEMEMPTFSSLPLPSPHVIQHQREDDLLRSSRSCRGISSGRIRPASSQPPLVEVIFHSPSGELGRPRLCGSRARLSATARTADL